MKVYAEGVDFIFIGYLRHIRRHELAVITQVPSGSEVICEKA